MACSLAARRPLKGAHMWLSDLHSTLKSRLEIASMALRCLRNQLFIAWDSTICHANLRFHVTSDSSAGVRLCLSTSSSSHSKPTTRILLSEHISLQIL